MVTWRAAKWKPFLNNHPVERHFVIHISTATTSPCIFEGSFSVPFPICSGLLCGWCFNVTTLVIMIFAFGGRFFRLDYFMCSLENTLGNYSGESPFLRTQIRKGKMKWTRKKEKIFRNDWRVLLEFGVSEIGHGEIKTSIDISVGTN